MKRIIRNVMFVGLVASLTLGLSSFNLKRESRAAHKGWELLGKRKVQFGLDKDVIKVGANEGGFRKLKVIVSGGGVNMHKMVVVYGNGSRDQVALRHNFRRGSDSRLIDLQGGKRRIKQIVFWYDTKNISKRRATVTVYGRH